MDNKLIRFTLRIDRLIFQKFRYIAKFEGRSINKEIKHCLRLYIAEFEKANGKIEVSDK